MLEFFLSLLDASAVRHSVLFCLKSFEFQGNQTHCARLAPIEHEFRCCFVLKVGWIVKVEYFRVFAALLNPKQINDGRI